MDENESQVKVSTTQVIQDWLLDKFGHNEKELAWSLIGALAQKEFVIINTTTLERILDGP